MGVILQLLIARYLAAYFKHTLFMKVIFLLIGLSLVIAIGFLIAFFWAVGTGQYEDDVTPSMRMLFDDTDSDKKHSKHE